jgi:iron complex transport system permease protein
VQSYSKSYSKQVLAFLSGLLVLVSLWSIKSGPIDTSFVEIIDTLGVILGINPDDPANQQMALIIQQIRLPRLILGILVGAGLAISGAVMQALFRNPMADPGLLGVSSGAALGAITTIVLGLKFLPGLFFAYGSIILPVMAFAGGLLTLLVVYRLARSNHRIDIPTMLLAGVALNSITGALIGLLSYVADDAQLRDLVFWSLGSLEITDWGKLLTTAFVIVPTLVLMVGFARPLNANLLGESEAQHLGVDIEKVKIQLIFLVSIVVGIAVAMSGIIGFVGLLVPHLLRMVVGPDHRLLLPASAIFGAILLVLADILARTLVTPAEMPIGIITAILGGPFFLWLLIRYRRKLAL